ncbi:GNAT family N-acetyltransferase [Fictibacillus nanhaiensis]|uniref:GNAT family N-acetyltransferase n=1 Tax=Fictibacillus nanhaiensis TaxID=742169 RepID=UPI001C97B44A|nr:GNAT family N-acetyltransferase [Fictibacillus nanhaiensis]MBY6037760.1 GNAT family N-acetyltransferase [Fictibacillus nanhaiensis]
MHDKERLELLIAPFFYLLNGMPEYLGLEQKHSVENELFSEIVEKLLTIGSQKHLNRVGVHLRNETNTQSSLARYLEECGFKHHSNSIEYVKNLSEEFEFHPDFSYYTLKDGKFTEKEFKGLWERVMQNSLNKRSTISMEGHLSSVKNELGSHWKHNCGVFYMQNRPIAVCIPHIEPGTEDEGRLFYFGLLPEERGKGYASKLHNDSLYLLKKMGASYYIGSTHESNKAMQKLFTRSGCKENARKSSYYYYFSFKKG